MRKPASMKALETLGRVRLSKVSGQSRALFHF